jgi:hypothetical protein
MLDTDPFEVIRLAILHATQNEMSGHDTRRLISDALDRAEGRVATQQTQVSELHDEITELCAEIDRCYEIDAAHTDIIISLREQLAEANERLRIVEAENDDCSETIMSQSRRLAEAQSTIEKARKVAPTNGGEAWRILSAPSSTGGNDSQGVALISAERKRQVTEEGYDAEHDEGHASDLARGASSYALAGADDLNGLGYAANDPFDPPADWPWHTVDWKPTGDAVSDLVKAGGLVAAALDSLLAE